ncbi:MAG: hypothetical protein Q9186_006774 [Xanthomendoza sp. 1 TL-2023]
MHPSKGPSSEMHPSKAPSSEVHPSGGPSSEAHPSRGPSSEVRHSRGPSSEVHPSKGPSSEVHPSRGPSSEVQPSRGPSSEVHPSKGPSSEVHPSRGPSSEVHPSRGPSSEIHPSRGPSVAPAPSSQPRTSDTPSTSTIDDHAHFFTITDALDDHKQAAGWKALRVRASRTNDPHPVSSSIAPSIPSPSLSVYNAFDGSSTYPTTATLSLTTKPATTFTTSGMTISKPATTVVATDKNGPPYPANGCWQDPNATDCPYIKSHTEATPTPTALPSNQFLKNGAPYFGAGIGVAILILVAALLALRYRAKRQRARMEAARDRQSKRMSDAKEASRAEHACAPVELRPMRKGSEMPQPTRVYSDGWFGGRSEVPTP